MITVDHLLLKIVNFTDSTIEEQIPKRDSKVLRSLATATTAPNFITENQARLLLKILKEHQEKITAFQEELQTVLENPSWSRSFRQIDRTKKCYISNYEDLPVLTIEFAFSSAIRKTLSSLGKKVSNLVQAVPGKVYRASLTEQNIIELVDVLSKLEFEIDEKIQNYYNTIKSWSEDDIRNQFKIDTITHSNFQKHITDDLGINTSIDQNIINDRSVRYQYFSEKTEKNPENLTEQIATRSSTKIWINKKEVSLTDIIDSLGQLRRFPMLVVFDSNDSKKCLEELSNLSESLEENNINNQVGIYFRLDNNGIGKEFNQMIADKQYNCQLDTTTKIVGIANGKIPKFLLKSSWKPMSVVSIGKLLNHNKTSVYTNCCDLVINWSDFEPITETRASWV
jgi:hypothetical protein